MRYDENRIGQQMAGQQEALRNLGPSPKECAPASIIEVQMGHLESRVDVVLKLAAVLENRLARVLRQADSPPVNRGSVSPSPNTGVMLGDALAMQSERLQDAINYLNATIERIEL